MKYLENHLRTVLISLSCLLFFSANSQVVESYKNDFNTPSDDFEGFGFSVKQEDGFESSAIHTMHPYPVASAPEKDTVLNYTFKKRIRVNGSNPIMRFDEIVLVFYKVVVEIYSYRLNTWYTYRTYSSGDKTEWYTYYYSNPAYYGDLNSHVLGKPEFYRTREINFLENANVKPGDEITIRFRLFSRVIGSGWGWVIDNLDIQPDVIPPIISHYHYDYMPSTANKVPIYAEVSDNFSYLNDTYVEYKVNGSSWTNAKLFYIGYYFLVLDLSSFNLKQHDTVFYKLKSIDAAGNESVLPEEGDWKIIVRNFDKPITTYFNDFEITNDDFVGNYFSISPLFGYPGELVQTTHPYPNGFGPNQWRYSILAFTLMKPIIIGPDHPVIQFDEAVLTEWNAQDDFVGVEGSKDFGNNWLPAGDYYNSRQSQLWMDYSDDNLSPTPKLFVPRKIDLLRNFNLGDTVIFRFTLYANGDSQRWGWAFDNVAIQSKITGLEDSETEFLNVYPNPTTDYLIVKTSKNKEKNRFQLFDSLGREVIASVLLAENENLIYVGNLDDGLYILKVIDGDNTLTAKLIIRK